ncbi:hypothetical protein O181_071533 [Austropuccinia psidii MF-1]|uniref:Integrase catalytic domain-containing protein n=1 Tax=Austropuccinia psidii MF-1 TaxID=1389203 RepID=A0A9Q3I8A1_9BASI|nr:hypothetical protein [Austropuccinia psidii MF-1]
MGPISQVDIHGNKYLLTLRDHASTFVFCFPLRSRDQVTKVLTDTLKLIQNVFKSSVKFIRSDNAKEYKENNFNVHLISMGTQHIFTSPYTPEQNGEAERLNRTLGDAARTMLRASGMPLTFWSYAYKVAAYIHNRIPNTKTGDKTPLELWCGRQPQAHRLHSFGAKAIVHIPAEKRGKLEDRGRVCKLVGFQDDSRGFFFWDKGNKAIINSNHVRFVNEGEGEQNHLTDKMKISNLVNKVSLNLGEENTEEICNNQDEQIYTLPTRTDINIPLNLKEAKLVPDWKQWEGAIARELNSFDEMDVWTPVEKTNQIKTIKTQFVFDLKTRPNQDPIYKARLVAKGFNQRFGVDCFETFAPTASLSSLRLLFAIAVQQKWKIASFDISVAYLHSDLKEEIYVEAPSDFRPNLKGKIMRLNKAMYGLKQAGRCWWLHFRKVMTLMGFQVEDLEQSLYFCKKDNLQLYVWMHVDDGVVFSNDSGALNSLRENLKQHLKVKWEDRVTKVVGIETEIEDQKIILKQEQFAKQIINNFEQKSGMNLLRTTTTLPDIQLTTGDGDGIETTWYQSIIGSLNYLALGTRPDISYSVNILARHSAKPNEAHWGALRHLLAYVKTTANYSLCYQPSTEQLELWRQKVVATSTCAAELISLGMATEFLIFVLQLVKLCLPSIETKILCDNKAATLALEGSRSRMKCIERNFYHVNDFIRKENIALTWVPTINQLADVFTKRLNPGRLNSILDNFVERGKG